MKFSCRVLEFYNQASTSIELPRTHYDKWTPLWYYRDSFELDQSFRVHESCHLQDRIKGSNLPKVFGSYVGGRSTLI